MLPLSIALAGLSACESNAPNDLHTRAETVLTSPISSLPGRCQVRDGFTSSPERVAHEVGDGYAFRGVQAKSIDEVEAGCTDGVYGDLMSKYCATSAHFPVQWEVSFSPLPVPEEGGTVHGCAKSGCDNHVCPPPRAACVIRTSGTVLPKLTDPDDGPGYAKVGVAANSLADAKARCNAGVFSKLSFCPAPGTVEREVIVADPQGHTQHACASIGCSRKCVVELPPG
jgi:hypothetical protein